MPRKDKDGEDEKRQEEESSSSEEDFMSDSLLANLENPKKGIESYSEKRKREINEAKEKGRIQNRTEREKQARKIGLGRNLLQDDNLKQSKQDDGGSKKRAVVEESKDASSNKALKMMLAMGYQYGRGLGREESVEKHSNREGIEGKEETLLSSQKALIEPLALDERWMGSKVRAGIGAFSAALSRDIIEATSKEANSMNSMSAEEQFRQRSKDEHTIRHYEKLLVDARRTCEDLDEKLKIKYSPLWLDPNSLYKPSDQLPEHIASLVEYAFKGLNDTGEEEKEDKDKDKDEEAIARAKESKRFCLLPARARLDITLSHLRRAHLYCLFCGHKYADQQEFNSQCPGEEEDDH